MARPLRNCPGGMVFHVLNRAVGRRRLFYKDEDYVAFLRVLHEAVEGSSMRVIAFCLMPNHWHMILWPRGADDTSAFMRWLTVTHSTRYHAHYHTAGQGHLYQGRFKSFPIQTNHYLGAAWRYVERNPVRARLVKRAEAWPWSSLAVRLLRQTADAPDWSKTLLCDDLLALPADWIKCVNEPHTAAEERAMKQIIARGLPLGDDAWQRATAAKLNLSLRPRGRPRKSE